MVDLPRLNTASQLTLVTIRLWVREHLRCQPHVTRWDEGLIAAGLPPQARRALDELLTMLALIPDMLSGILPVCAHRVSDSELALLAEQRCMAYARAMGERVSEHQLCPAQRMDEITLSSAGEPLPQRMH